MGALVLADSGVAKSSGRIGAGQPAAALAIAVVAWAQVATGAGFDRPSHLEYRFAWNGIPAAYARVDVKRARFAGEAGYVVEATGRTNRIVDLFWKFRGNARSMFLAEGFKPLSFWYKRRENSKKVTTWIDFDGDRAKAVRVKRGKRKIFEADGAHFVDPMNAVFRARARAVRVGDSIRQGVFTGERRYDIALTVVAAETVKVPAGRFEAWRLKPSLVKFSRKHGTKKPDSRLRNATIWVTRDPSHVLLRIRGDVFVGAVTLDLVRAGPAAGGREAARPQGSG